VREILDLPSRPTGQNFQGLPRVLRAVVFYLVQGCRACLSVCALGWVSKVVILVWRLDMLWEWPDGDRSAVGNT
jgi:hypothetical protein